MKAVGEASQLFGENHEGYWSGIAPGVLFLPEPPGQSGIGTCEVPI